VATTSPRIASNPQLTLADWETFCVEATQADDRPPPPSEPPRAILEVDVVTKLADALAARLAEQLTTRMPSVQPRAPASTPLLTLDDVVAELPPAKPAKTWKRWLYERTRRGEVPGCVKLGGMLFFEREPVRAWIRAGAGTRQPAHR
jgi:hypothetical protein